MATFCLVTENANAQQQAPDPQWTYMTGPPLGFRFLAPRGMDVDSQGNLYIVANAINRDPCNVVPFVYKIGPDGNLLSMIQLLTAGECGFMQEIAVAPDGFYVTGNEINPQQPSFSAVMTGKWDYNGNRLWLRVFDTPQGEGGSFIDDDSMGTSVYVGVQSPPPYWLRYDADGNLLLPSQPLVFLGPLAADATGMVMLTHQSSTPFFPQPRRYAPDGSILWTNLLSPQFGERGDLKRGPDEQYLVAAEAAVGGIQRRFVLVRFSSNTSSMIVDPDFTKQVNEAGYGTQGDLYGTGSANFGTQFLTQKFDPEGTFVWSSTLAFFARGAIANQMSVDVENNLYISGNVGTDQSGVQMMVVKYKDAVCAPLETDDFKQCDLLWGPEHYDRTSPPETICDKGCAITSLAMLNNFYRDTFGLSIASMTPVSMNVDLLNLGPRGYDSNASLVWDAIDRITNSQITAGDPFTQDPDEDGFVYNLNQPWSLDQLVGFVKFDLEAGRPVVVRISGANFRTHFMLATGSCADKFQVADPLGARTEFDPKDLGTLLTGIRRFKNSP